MSTISVLSDDHRPLQDSFDDSFITTEIAADTGGCESRHFQQCGDGLTLGRIKFNAMNAPGLRIFNASNAIRRTMSRPSTPENNASAGSCCTTSGCKESRSSSRMYGGLLTSPSNSVPPAISGCSTSPAKSVTRSATSSFCTLRQQLPSLAQTNPSQPHGTKVVAGRW